MRASALARWAVVTDEAAAVRARRERLGYTIKQLAEEAEVAEDTLGDGEAGRRELRASTWGKVIRALERLETEAGIGAPARVIEEAVAGTAERPLVRYRIEGNFGVSAVVEGPVENIEELEASVARLIAGMQQGQGNAEPG